MIGEKIYDLCKELFPINRSLTGDGVRKTLNILKKELPDLEIHEVPTGTKCFDWTIPKEWNCKEAYIMDPDGNKICDITVNNLHLMGYSIPINKVLNLDELNNHLYSLPEFPEAIPYITSYYKERWGFCISEKQRRTLKDGEYKVYINSILKDGSLTYGELLIKGKTTEEIFLSTYICHPSMGNNELSGPTVTTYLAKYIELLKNKRYSYRIIFIPETIGSIMYLSKYLDIMKKNIQAGFVLTCIGDNNAYSFLPSRNGNTLADKVSRHVLKHHVHDYKEYSFLDDRGSDERQYCAPGIDLAVCSIMRTKYGEYKEYHTSLDNLDYISPDGLNGAYEIYVKVIETLENNISYKVNVLGEPQLGKRGLYPTISTKETKSIVKDMMNVLTYCDGKLSLLDIAEKMHVSIWELYDIVDNLVKEKLLV
jgi:aminopeptidase-like protein